MIYLGDRYSYLVPHVVRSYNNALGFHEKLWDYDAGRVYVMLTDFHDYGNGGAITMPINQVILGIVTVSPSASFHPAKGFNGSLITNSRMW